MTKNNKIQIAFLGDTKNPYRVIVDSMLEGAILFTLAGKIIYCNKAFSKFVNSTTKKIIGSYIDHYIVDNQKLTLEKFIKNKKKTHLRGEFLLNKKNKSEMLVLFSANKLKLSTTQIISIVITDLTELSKKKEIELNNLINHLNQINTKLKISVNLAEEADKAKSEFLANMSHELRSPLNSIIGYAELLHYKMVGDISQKQNEYLEEILLNSSHLLQLINQVLDLSRIEARKIELNPEPIFMSKLISDVIHDLKLSLAEKNIKINIQLDPTLEEITLDPIKFKQAVYNYLSNAIKFIRSKGIITISTKSETKNSFRVEVRDNGIGIRSKDLPLLFVPFQQLHSGISKEYQGSGIGLSLTKAIIEAQGGKVGVESTFGKGSCFYFILPLKPKIADKYQIIT